MAEKQDGTRPKISDSDAKKKEGNHHKDCDLEKNPTQLKYSDDEKNFRTTFKLGDKENLNLNCFGCCYAFLIERGYKDLESNCGFEGVGFFDPQKKSPKDLIQASFKIPEIVQGKKPKLVQIQIPPASNLGKVGTQKYLRSGKTLQVYRVRKDKGISLEEQLKKSTIEESEESSESDSDTSALDTSTDEGNETEDQSPVDVRPQKICRSFGDAYRVTLRVESVALYYATSTNIMNIKLSFAGTMLMELYRKKEKKIPLSKCGHLIRGKPTKHTENKK